MRILVCVLALLASGCTTHIIGLRYEGIDTPRQLPPLRDMTTTRRPVPGVLMRMSSAQDLGEQLPVFSVHASLCRNGEYDGAFRVDTNGLWTAEEPARMPPAPPGRFLQWVWLRMTMEPWKSPPDTFVAYDLRRGGDDICLRLSGMRGVFSPLRGNTVVVPAADIRRAARDERGGHP